MKPSPQKPKPTVKPLRPTSFHYQDEVEIAIRYSNQSIERAALKQWERPRV